MINCTDDFAKAGDVPVVWWSRFHSGSEAMQIAREFLSGEMDPLCVDCTHAMALVCAELIFRVTGEQLAPFGVSVDIARGVAYSRLGTELEAINQPEANPVKITL